MTDILRRQVLKLAHEKPELRRHLVPLLRTAAGDRLVPLGDVTDAYRLAKQLAALLRREKANPEMMVLKVKLEREMPKGRALVVTLGNMPTRDALNSWLTAVLGRQGFRPQRTEVGSEWFNPKTNIAVNSHYMGGVGNFGIQVRVVYGWVSAEEYERDYAGRVAMHRQAKFNPRMPTTGCP